MSVELRVILVILHVFHATSCTNILVSRGATTDGAIHLSYNADDVNLYGSLGHYPATDHAAGDLRDIWDWDDAVYLGSIPEVVFRTKRHQGSMLILLAKPRLRLLLGT